jgi:hypothetical protein
MNEKNYLSLPLNYVSISQQNKATHQKQGIGSL